jgi:lipoyl(octanoyl) transferase
VTEPRRTIRWSWLGRVGYEAAAALQVEVREALARGAGPERLLLLEHPPVYTLGRNATRGHVLAGAEELAARGVEVAATDRGGQVTYHGPGQLVGYPIVDLSPDRRDLRRYVRELQEVLVAVLARHAIAAHGGAGERIGVWVRAGRAAPGDSGVGGERKIASIGIHLARWRTTHGFALNVTTDLAQFRGIVACGLPEVEMTSIAREIGVDAAPPLERLAEEAAREFARRFERELARDDRFAAEWSGARAAAARE